jgi:hypothetical protein
MESVIENLKHFKAFLYVYCFFKSGHSMSSYFKSCILGREKYESINLDVKEFWKGG